MKSDYEKMLKSFEKKHGRLADWKGTRESYFVGLSLFLDGWLAGKAFQKGVQRALRHKSAAKSKPSGKKIKLQRAVDVANAWRCQCGFLVDGSLQKCDVCDTPRN